MKKKAINALIEMGMPADIKGFHYIVEIMCMFENVQWRNSKMMTIYGEVAKRNNDTVSKVERAIRHAFGIITERGYLEAVNKYLTMQNPTNGNLLHTLYLRLSMEEKE